MRTWQLDNRHLRRTPVLMDLLLQAPRREQLVTVRCGVAL